MGISHRIGWNENAGKQSAWVAIQSPFHYLNSANDHQLVDICICVHGNSICASDPRLVSMNRAVPRLSVKQISIIPDVSMSPLRLLESVRSSKILNSFPALLPNPLSCEGVFVSALGRLGE